MEELELGNFNGTESYHKISLYPEVNLTDGVAYIMENGFSWFVTDMLAVIECNKKIKAEEFLSIKLKVENEKAVATITDGNEKVLYKQNYAYTDAKQDINLFFTNNVLMLSQEY